MYISTYLHYEEDDRNHCWINYVHDSYFTLECKLMCWTSQVGNISNIKKNQVLLGTFVSVFGGCLSCVIVRDGCGFEFILLFYEYLWDEWKMLITMQQLTALWPVRSTWGSGSCLCQGSENVEHKQVPPWVLCYW